MKTPKLVVLHTANLHNAEFSQFIARFFEDFAGSGISLEADATFKELYESLNTKIPVYNKALEQVRAKEESKKLSELDKVRDADVQALKDSIKPYRNAKTEAKQKAYHAIKLVLDGYKDVIKDTYEEETNRVKTLISTLKSAQYQAQVETLKIGEFLGELETSNTAFNELFSHRSLKDLQKEVYNVKGLRKELTDIYQKLSAYINANAQVKPDEFFVKTLEVLNNSRKYYADVLARRKAGGKPSAETVKGTGA